MSQKILTDSFQVFDTAELVFKRLVFYPKIYPLDIGQSQSKDFFFFSHFRNFIFSWKFANSFHKGITSDEIDE